MIWRGNYNIVTAFLKNLLLEYGVEIEEDPAQECEVFLFFILFG